jgi:multicomponent Na+:H+ antiporter subunit E
LAARFALFVLLWVVAASWSPENLPVGLAAAAGVLWVSLRLLPPRPAQTDAIELLAFVSHILRGSLVAGFDVARRALAPRIDLQPGFVACPLHLPDGDARRAFCLLQSLMPGTLPTGAEGENLIVHGLDMSQPIAENLAADERRFGKALGHE